MTIELRPYQPGDEAAIRALFEGVFRRPLSDEFWRWRYRDHPGGGPYAELAWDGDRLAGHYAVAASPLAIDGERHPASLSMTTMIHPDYRGQRLFERSAEQLYERLIAEQHVAVYGFPNPNSHRGFLTRLGWGSIYEIPTLTLAIDPVRHAAPVPQQVGPVAGFDSAFDAHWDRVKGRHRIWTWRDAAYLRWRYDAMPETDYVAAAWREGGQVEGYAVAKVYAGQSLDLVDLVADDKAVIQGLLAWAVDHARSQGLPGIATWAPVHGAARIPMESMGFRADAPVTYFGCRPFGAAGVDMHDPRNWGFAMSDSDVY